MSKIIRIVFIAILFLTLVVLRGVFRDALYDPLTKFFGSIYMQNGFPSLNKLQYFITLCIRYTVNTGVSLLIIYLFFSKKEIVILALKIYIVVFLILNILFFLEFEFNFTNSYLVLFYVRRFLIHPLLLLVLLPAFYYQVLMKKK